MFVRRKHNKSGSTSVQVVAKIGGKYRVQKSFGSSRDEAVLTALGEKARQWVKESEYGHGDDLFPSDEAAAYDEVLAGIGQDQLRLVGPDLIYGRLFDKIGFGAVRTSDNELFKSLVVTRLYRPGSKLKTLRYLAYFMNRYYNEDKIYRFLDNLCWRPERRQKENGDDVRIPGWSKDGKDANPQVVLGLLVGPGGNPIGYEIHPGNTYDNKHKSVLLHTREEPQVRELLDIIDRNC